jgi:hypothetical protein
MQALLQPDIIASAAAGLVVGLALVVAMIRTRHQIGNALARIGRLLFSQIGFFGLVMVVFMAVSVLESGDFFSVNITHQAVFGLLGYALALGFDLVSVTCMMAR